MDFRSSGVVVPFVEHLGVELLRMEDGESTLQYDTRPEHVNSFEVTHGGAVMTLLDVAMAVAARSLETGLGVVTIEMKTSFMQPSRGKLLAKGHVMHRTGSMAFCEGTVTDARGRACAHASGTFKYVPRTPIGPEGANRQTVISTD